MASLTIPENENQSSPVNVSQRTSVTNRLGSLPEPIKRIVEAVFTSTMILGLVTGIYVFSVIWRVSWYEQMLFGRSTLIPLSMSPREFTDFPNSPDLYGAYTFNATIQGKEFRVHKQTINGFQHAFGSALASYEIGDDLSDLLFRANEYLEAYCCKDGRRYSHYLDTKKDLYNNSIGRRIGAEAREHGLIGEQAEEYMADRVITALHRREVIQHFYDPEVQVLPSLDAFGCPGLPRPEPWQ